MAADMLPHSFTEFYICTRLTVLCTVILVVVVTTAWSASIN